MNPLHTFNRTKIVCTLGPASASYPVLKQLIQAGMDVCRLNFSHGTHEDHQVTLDLIRKLNGELGTHIAILQDLQGPKMRIGKLEQPFPIKPGDEVIISTSIQVQQGNILPIQYESFAKDVNAGELLLVDDGKVELRVVETNKVDTVRLVVNHGDAIGSKKGVNLPYTEISLPSITPKDLRDVEFGIRNNVEWIALSFVRTAAEVIQLKEYIRERGGKARIISKIEKPEALKNIDSIIDASDGIMVARGDLGVEIFMEDVPMWQKVIIRKSNAAGKPVIVATQMMESMIENRRPTRAETNDVANAVMDGADALMLSGETSVGRFPVEVVQSMQKIIATMENQDEVYNKRFTLNKSSRTYIHDAIIQTACTLSEETEAAALIGMTRSGYTAFELARHRPKAGIFIFTDNQDLLTTLSLVWGVRTIFYDRFVSTDETFADIEQILKDLQLVRVGDVIINTASMPIHARKRTNMVKVSVVS